LALAGCRAEECLFIDNNESNLIAPKKLAWNTIFYDDKKNDFEMLIKELEIMGVSAD
jgi:FMN phosphatase YigB (HAD superfamily)